MLRVRQAEPSPYEEAVGAVLERLLGDGVADLEGLCRGLNQARLLDPARQPWLAPALAAFLAGLP